MGFAIEKGLLESLANYLINKSRLFEQFCLLA